MNESVEIINKTELEVSIAETNSFVTGVYSDVLSSNRVVIVIVLILATKRQTPEEDGLEYAPHKDSELRVEGWTVYK